MDIDHGSARPAILASLLFLTVKEPQRQAPIADVERRARRTPRSDARSSPSWAGTRLKAIHAQRPGLLSVVRGAGAERDREPRPAILARALHDPHLRLERGGDRRRDRHRDCWSASLPASPSAASSSNWLGKRYKDANVRAAFICFCGTTVSTIAALLMPTAGGRSSPSASPACSALPARCRRTPRSSASRPIRCAGR